MTTITTVIPAYNRAHVIGAAIDSVLTQQVPPGHTLAVCVVDDGSSDDLARALRPYGTAVRCIRHDRNLGAAAARNTGVRAASEGLVAFLDSDDTWLPGKLVAQIDAMRAGGWVASCTAYCIARDGEREFVSPRYKTGTLTLDDVVWGCFVSPGSTLMFERSVFADVGPLDPHMKRLEDWDWLMRLVQKYPLGFFAQPLARISPAVQTDPDRVLAAIETMREKHLHGLSARHQRHFLSALDLERGATYFRDRNYAAAFLPVMKSLFRSPVGNAALAATLHNRLARG